ncbi:hypothetical protein [Syntrophobacter fumaroxidans]|nr:hypothetical protein [Syntrophobacter fumaroxidans]
MKAFRDHLEEKLHDRGFRDIFDEERGLVRIGIEVAEARAKLGISQVDLAKQCSRTQASADSSISVV